MKIAFDSNILVYSAMLIKVDGDREKANLVRSLTEQLAINHHIICPLQTFGEAYHVMQRNGRTRAQCREMLQDWLESFDTVPSNGEAFLSAIDLATEHNLQFWDALILSVAAHAGCQLLLSEDLQPGFAWRGITVVDPFAAKMDPRLSRALSAEQ